MFNGSYGASAGNSLGSCAGNGVGEPWEGRWCWLFGVHPIQDRAD